MKGTESLANDVCLATVAVMPQSHPLQTPWGPDYCLHPRNQAEPGKGESSQLSEGTCPSLLLGHWVKRILVCA